MNEKAKTAKVRQLNDQFRQTGRGGRIMLTSGIQALGQQSIMEIMAKIRAFDKFTKDNDPYLEHDFAKIEHNGDAIFWKIDYYDRAMEFGSNDPSDPTVTMRVMTVMMADEY
ncbi:MAG: DUF3768 domain-containing protein [Candidatus Methylumidiphilus sp.]